MVVHMAENGLMFREHKVSIFVALDGQVVAIISILIPFNGSKKG